MYGIIQSTDKSSLLTNDKKLYYNQVRLNNQLCLLKSLIEDNPGVVEEDPIFTASPAFNVTDPDIASWNIAAELAHEHANILALNSITTSLINDWNAAYSFAVGASSLFLSKQGGDLTGVNGLGYIRFPNQSASAPTPADGFSLYSNASNHPVFIGTNGLRAELVLTVTANRVYTFPDITGDVVLTTGPQTISGNKTFSGTTQLGATNINGLFAPTANNTVDIGGVSLRFSSIYAQAFRGNGTLRLSSGATNSIVFQRLTDADTIGVAFSTGNWRFQAPAAIPPDTGERLQVAGTSLLNGAVGLGGTITPTVNNTHDLGTPTFLFGTLYTNASLSVTNYVFGSTVTTGLLTIRQGSTSQLIAGFHPTTGNHFLQVAGVTPTDDGISRLQVIGKIRVTDVPTYADNAAAISGGLIVGNHYKLADGSLKIVI